MRRSKGYMLFICLLILFLLLGLWLLVYGSTQQGPLPQPTLVVPRQIHHG